MVRRAQRRGPLLGRARSCRPASGGSSTGTARRRPARPGGGEHGRLRLRRRAARPGRRDQPPADRRPGPALDRGRRGQRRGAARPRGRRRRRTPPCCATPARSPSPPPRSTPGPPRSAAPGTPGSRRSWWTPCCAPRPTRRCSPGPARSGWAARGDVAVVLGSAAPQRARDRHLRRGTPGRAGRPAWTPCAPPRATVSSWCSAASSTPRAGRRRGRRPVRAGPGRGRAR